MTHRLLIAAALVAVLPADLSAAQPTATTTVLTASPSPGTITGVTLTATVSDSGATGKVTFYNGPVVLGTATLNGSAVATLSNVRLPISTTNVGLTLTARYTGDSTFAASVSPGLLLPITATPGRNFAPPAGALPTGNFQTTRILQADFNNDGLLDLAFFGTNDNKILIYLGNSDGTLNNGNPATSPPAAAATLSTPNKCSDAVAADFDRDGKQDIACYSLNEEFDVYKGNGDGTFQARQSYASSILTNSGAGDHYMIAAADFNGDGLPDLAVTGFTIVGCGGICFTAEAVVAVLLNDGTGAFPSATLHLVSPIVASKPTTLQGYELTLGDFNQDGKPDVVVAARLSNSSTDDLFLLIGTGNGTLNTGAALGTAVNTVRNVNLAVLLSGDFNNDGITDILYRSDVDGSIVVGRNGGNGTFTFVSSANNINRKDPLAIGDFDGDGILDVVGRLSGNGIAVSLGNGDGTFARPLLPAIASCSGNGAYPVTGDYNGDHRTDFIVFCSNNGPTVELAKATSTTTLLASPNPSNFGQSVTLTATVSPSSATGSVVFFEGTHQIGAAVLASGTAALTTTLLPASALPSGTLTLSAHYVGDVTLGDSTSNTISQTVTARPGKGFTAAPNAAALTGPQAVAVGDFNNDGFADLAISNSTSITISLGNGDGTFTNLGAFAAQSSAFLAVGDFNGDGVQDLAAMFLNNGGIGIYLGNKQPGGAGNGTFTASPLVATSGVALSGIAVADFNNDGVADIGYSANNAGTAQFNFVPGNGNGTFGTKVSVNIGGVTPGQIATADFDHNGGADAVVPSSNAQFVYSLYYIKGFGDGTFTSTNLNTPTTSPTVVSADFNGDGFADLAYSDASGNIRIGLNSGNGTFSFGNPIASGGNSTLGLAVADFNGDGKLDLAATLTNTGSVAILLGNGLGGFTSQGPVSVGTSPQNVVIGDFNGDNRADFAVSAQASNIVAVRLETGPNATQVTPSSTVAGAKNLQLVIAGTNFFAGEQIIWQPSAQGSSPTTLPAQFNSANQLTVLPSATLDALVTATGTATISVQDPTIPGLVSAPLTFTITGPPSISTLAPNTAAAGGTGLTVTIAGQNFVSGDTVTWKPNVGTTVTGIATTFQSGALTLQLTPALLQNQGVVSILVVDPSGVSSAGATFTVQPPPALTLLSPTSAPAGGAAFTLTITGTGFVAGDTVTWTPNGAAAQPLSNAQVGGQGGQITVQVPANLLATTGTATVTVTDPDGATSNSLTFSIAAPTITVLNPLSVGTANSDFTLVINGNNFIPGTNGGGGYSGSVVLFTDTTGAQHTLIPTASTTTQLSVLVSPASTLIGNVAGKSATVAVQNPPNAGQNPVGVGGAVSSSASLPVGAPTISNISPTSATVGGNTGLTITVTGTNFVAGSGLIWCNNCGGTGTLLPAPTSITPTQIVGTVPLNLLQAVGSAQISVSNTPPAQGNPNSGNLTDPNTNSTTVAFQISSLGISSISPTNALAGGPDFVLTINGLNQNFDGGAKVLFGNGLAALTPAQSNGSITGNLITVTVPAAYIANPGSLSIQVQNSNGATSNAVALPVQQLAITGLTPAALVAGSGSQSLIVNGTSFSSNTQIQWTQGITTTTLASAFVNTTQINAIVPQSLVLQAGAAQLVALTPVQSTNVSSAAQPITISGPAISSLTPSSSIVNGSSFAMQVTGSSFLSGSIVQWTTGTGQVQSLVTSFVNAAQLTAIVPSNLVAASGTALVTVVNPGGGATGATSNGVVFAIGPTPTINTNPIGLSVCPGGINCTAGTSVTAGTPTVQLKVAGTNYQSGSIVVWTANGVATNLVTAFVDDKNLAATLPASLIFSPGTSLVTVQNPGNATSNGVIFTVSPGVTPVLSSLNPTSTVAGGSAFQLAIAGSNFASGAVVQWANGATTQALTTIFQDANDLSAVVPANLIANTGTVFISVSSAGALSTGLPFTINPVPPVTITSLDQTSLTAGGGAVTLGINGTNFTSSSVAQWSAGAGPQALATIFVNSTKLSALVPAALTANSGTAFINITNGVGQISNTVSLGINPQSPPTINVNGLNPSSATAGSTAFQLTITGTNFTSGSQVQWNSGSGPQSLPTIFIDSNHVTLVIPTSLVASVGTAFVDVQNPGGITSALVSFPVIGATSPVITGTPTPSSAVAGSAGFQITINGTNFVAGAAVNWNSGSGSPQALATIFVNSTQVTALVPAALIAAAGAAYVSVVNPGGAASNVALFSISSVPTISINGGLSPSSANTGSAAFQLVVLGTNFTNGSVVQWNSGSGAQPLTTAFINATQLTAVVPSGNLTTSGTAFVTVQNPGGATSNLVGFSIIPAQGPTINTTGGLLPSSVVAGAAAFTMVVNGTNFTSASTVQWNSGTGAAALPTQFVNSNQLLAQVTDLQVAAVGNVLVTVQNTGGIVSNIVTFVINAAPPSPPLISGLAPQSGTAGGPAFLLVVNGANFLAGSVVQWNNGTGGAAQPLSTAFVNASSLSALVPASLIANQGVVFISVQVTGGASSNVVQFAINPAPSPTPPAISAGTALNPSSATAGSATFQLTVTGSGFLNTSVVQWSSGGAPQSLVTSFVSATQLTAVVPAGLVAAAGNAFVSVQNPGSLNSIAVQFTIAASPTAALSGLSPTSATAAGPAFILLVNGSNFASGATVQWNATGTPQPLVTTFVNATQLTAVVPANLIASAATVFVSVQLPGGSSTGVIQFNINGPPAPQAPTISASGGLSPGTVVAGSTAFQLTINGTNFVTGSVVQWNPGNAAQPLATSFLNATQLTAVVPANLLTAGATVFVSVLNPGNLASNTVPFVISAAPVPAGPAILSPGGLTPSSITAGTPTFQLSISGSGFTTAAVVQWVTGGSPQALTTAYLSASQLTALVPAALIANAGTAFVSVQNGAGGQVSNLVIFTISAIAAPTISTSGGISPQAAATGSNGVTLTITGTNFFSGSVVQWNSGGGAQALTSGFVSSTQLTALIPASLLVLPTTALITVLNPDHTVSNAITFAVIGSAPATTPTLTNISPVSAAAGSSSLTLAVAGQNFTAGTANAAGSSVFWNGSPLPTTFVSATQLNAQVDGSLLQTAGANFVTVQNGNASSGGTRFQVNGPTLGGLSPSSAVAGGPAFALTVTGANFVAGSVAVWNGGNLATTVNSATQLTAQVPATLIATSGTAFVLVTNPGGSSTSPLLFTLTVPPAPAVSGLNPPSAIAGASAFQLTVIGSGFVNGSVVSWNGAPLATGYISATQITALVSSTLIATAGTANVTVQNPGAPLSAPISFPVVGPTISSLSPAGASAGDPSFSLTVTGANFVPGSAVQWNSAALPSAYISSTQVLATVPAANVAFQSTATITVSNPGGAVSGAQPFTIGPPAVSVATTSLPDGVVGTFYSQVLLAQGGTQPYTWTITTGVLPDGLSLDPGSGTISGTPTGSASAIVGVTVTDQKARSASRPLQLRIAQSLTITTASPLLAAVAGSPYSVVLTATGGTAPYLWSSAGGLPPGLNLNVATGEISGTPTAPGGYRFSIGVTDSRGQQTISKSFISTVTVSSLTIGGVSAVLSPAQQLTMSVAVGAPYTIDLTGSLTVIFTSAVGGDDSSIQFSTGGRTVNFTIPAGSTQAVFAQNQQVLLSTGTLAGTILVKASLQASASDITPSPAPQTTGAVPKLAPVITSATLKQITGGVSVAIAGYATGKEVVQGTLQFNPAAGSSLNSSTVTVPLTAVINAWYASAASSSFGSQFTVTVPVNVNGDVSAIGSVTVTLTNTQGNSAAVTATLQ